MRVVYMKTVRLSSMSTNMNGRGSEGEREKNMPKRTMKTYDWKRDTNRRHIIIHNYFPQKYINFIYLFFVLARALWLLFGFSLVPMYTHKQKQNTHGTCTLRSAFFLVCHVLSVKIFTQNNIQLSDNNLFIILLLFCVFGFLRFLSFRLAAFVVCVNLWNLKISSDFLPVPSPLSLVCFGQIILTLRLFSFRFVWCVNVNFYAIFT